MGKQRKAHKTDPAIAKAIRKHMKTKSPRWTPPTLELFITVLLVEKVAHTFPNLGLT